MQGLSSPTQAHSQCAFDVCVASVVSHRLVAVVYRSKDKVKSENYAGCARHIELIGIAVCAENIARKQIDHDTEVKKAFNTTRWN